MRTLLLAAAISAALVIPVVTYREPTAPLATVESQVEELDPVLDMASRGCTPTIQHLEDGLSMIRLCSGTNAPE
jgi:hypothetical protein